MAALLTPQTLAKWTQSDEAEVLADPFAADLIEKLSALVCFIGGHDGTKLDELGAVIPEWSLVADTPVGSVVAPIDVQMVMLQVAKRSYQNPDEVLQEGSVGPLGGERYADVHALFMDFTDSERATISKYNLDGDPTPQDGAGVVFTIPTTRGDETTLPQTSPLYIGDNQQIGLADSADPREWMIPLFNPGDPGDDSLYV
jgi:hypothetical protein